jgi:hypothetical protein
MKSIQQATLYSRLKKAKNMERTDLLKSIGEYIEITCYYPLNRTAYNRLMIIFRKLKMPIYEMIIIDKAIGIFQRPYQHGLCLFNRRYIACVDCKGQLVYDSQKIKNWQERKNKLSRLII